jgi:hypothetical protein
MANKHKHKRDGRWIDDYEVDDGGEVSVNVMTCDAKPRWVRPLSDAEAVLLDGHRPGYRVADQVADRQRVHVDIARDGARAAREEMIDRARSGWRMDKRRPEDDAWRGPAPSPKLAHGLPTGPHGPSVRDAAPEPPDKEAMYAQRCRDLENAWRSPAGAGPQKAGAGPSWRGPGA